MLAPEAVDVHSWNLSNYYFTMFYICRTIRRHFSSCALVSGHTNKSLQHKEGRNGRLSERPSEWILNSYFAFCKIVLNWKWSKRLIKVFAVICVGNRTNASINKDLHYEWYLKLLTKLRVQFERIYFKISRVNYNVNVSVNS